MMQRRIDSFASSVGGLEIFGTSEGRRACGSTGLTSRMGESLQAIVPGAIPPNDELQIADPRSLPWLRSFRLSDEGNRREFEVTPGAASVLILS